jgi:hypothetical protein
MLAINAKRGIESATQKVFQSSGRKFSTFKMLWHGATAKVTFDDSGTAIIVLPAIDETKEVSKKLFNDLIAYILHELGHVWFTNNAPWHDTAREHGKYVGTLINALEDPRIERKVIESGYAPNSADLFNSLINNVLVKGGFPDELTKQSLPFILCVEGRRLNGYVIDIPDLITGSPFEEHIRWALDEAHKALNTMRIAEVALELYKRLFDDDEEGSVEEPEEEGKDGGKGGEESGDDEGESESEGDGKPSGADGEDKGKMKDDGTDPRDPEINDYIDEEAKPLKCGADKRSYRPVLNSEQLFEFNIV